MAVNLETKNSVVGTSSTLTTPKVITSINDANGNEIIKTPATGSAVNEVTITNAAAGNAVAIACTGGDPNIGLTLSGKGTGVVKLGQATSAGVDLAADQPIRDSSGNELLAFGKTGSAVNEVKITNAATSGVPLIESTGGDTDIPIQLRGKGTGAVYLGQSTCQGIALFASSPLLDANNNELIKFTVAASAVNEITLANAATGNGVSIAATGGDADIALTLAGKGTGAVKLGQATSTDVRLLADQPIADSSGNELVKFVKTASAVNEFTITNQATGASPDLAATGGDTNISIKLTPKGTGKVVPSAPNLGFTTVSNINTVGAATYTAAQILGGMITRDPNGGNRIDVLPAADLLVAAIPGAVVGTSFLTCIHNTADAAETLEWDPGSGGTFANTKTITQKGSAILLIVLTNVTPAAEAYTGYIVSTGDFTA